eukprot:11219375-Ditylum_brightwellii.AAC.1
MKAKVTPQQTSSTQATARHSANADRTLLKSPSPLGCCGQTCTTENQMPPVDRQTNCKHIQLLSEALQGTNERWLTRG